EDHGVRKMLACKHLPQRAENFRVAVKVRKGHWEVSSTRSVHQSFPHQAHDLGMNDFDWRPRVHQRDALRLAAGDLQKPVAHPLEKGVALLFEAVLVGQSAIGPRIAARRISYVCGSLVATPGARHA